MRELATIAELSLPRVRVRDRVRARARIRVREDYEGAGDHHGAQPAYG